MAMQSAVCTWLYLAGEWVYHVHVRDILRKFMGHNFASYIKIKTNKRLLTGPQLLRSCQKTFVSGKTIQVGS